MSQSELDTAFSASTDQQWSNVKFPTNVIRFKFALQRLPGWLHFDRCTEWSPGILTFAFVVRPSVQGEPFATEQDFSGKYLVRTKKFIEVTFLSPCVDMNFNL